VATVFQDLAPVEVLDVSTNMFLGQFPRRGWFIDRKAMEAQSRAFLEEHKVTVASVRTEIGMLSGGQRQIVAIARAMRTVPGSSCSTSRRQPWASARPPMPPGSSVSCATRAPPSSASATT
jgi:hypothetical protein